MQTILVLHRLRWWIRKTHWIFIDIVWLIVVSHFLRLLNYHDHTKFGIFICEETHFTLLFLVFLEKINYRIWWQSLYKVEGDPSRSCRFSREIFQFYHFIRVWKLSNIFWNCMWVKILMRFYKLLSPKLHIYMLESIQNLNFGYILKI